MRAGKYIYLNCLDFVLGTGFLLPVVEERTGSIVKQSQFRTSFLLRTTLFGHRTKEAFILAARSLDAPTVIKFGIGKILKLE